MNIKLIILLILGIWIGLVLGISFIEAPLKFKAPGITTALGLGIGRLVFGFLDKVQIAFVILLVLLLYLNGYKSLSSGLMIGFGILILIQAVQSIFLVPLLDLRAQEYISNGTLAPSNIHFYYVALEVIKVVLLFFTFIKFYLHE